jgi:uncharacterized membrane protein
MPLGWRKISGAWVGQSLWHKVAGVWDNTPHQIYVKASGTWRPQLATAYDVLLPADFTISNIELEPTNAYAYLDMQTDGRIGKVTADGTTYAAYLDATVPITNAGAAYEVYVTKNAGSPYDTTELTSNAGLGTWLALSTLRRWGILRSVVVGYREVWLDVTVREIANTANSDTMLVKLYVMKEANN